MDELIPRIEAASGPDRELDGEIFATLGWSPILNPSHAGGLVGRWGRDGLMTGQDGAPLYTKSLDQAVMLVPDDAQWTFDSHYNIARIAKYYEVDSEGPLCDISEGESATPALALCAAALRARQS